MLGLAAGPGAVIADAQFLKAMRDAFAEGGLRNGRDRCEWSPLCTTIAGAGFEGVLVTREDA